MRQVHMNMANGVRQFGRASPNQVVAREGERSVTFGELDERSSRLANALLARGLRPGDPVAVLSPNSVEFFEIATAVAKAGFPMVPLNPRNSVFDNEFIIGHSGTRGLVLSASLAANVERLTDDLSAVISFGPDEGEIGEPYGRVVERADGKDPMIEVAETDTFAIAYTSGTTGRPKGVQLTHRGRVLTAYGTAIEYALGPGRRTMAVAPMYLGAGFSFGYAGAQVGGAVTVLSAWDAEEFLRLVERDRVQSAFLVPTHAQQIRRLTDDPRARFDLSSLDTLYFNAAALPIELKEWVIEEFPGVAIHELYGSTEASVVTSLRPWDALRKAGSVGHAWFMNEVKLVDDDKNPVPPGQPGELFSRSPMLMSGYLHNEEATREAMTDDGFLSVGDIAVADDEGYISIIDRKKDMIIAGGVNIYPREIEEVVAKHSGVDECAVIGVPDEVYGERVVAFVVTRRGEPLDTAALAQHVRERVASFKVPREWHVMDALPRSPAGKILKTAIRENYSSQQPSTTS